MGTYPIIKGQLIRHGTTLVSGGSLDMFLPIIFFSL